MRCHERSCIPARWGWWRGRRRLRRLVGGSPHVDPSHVKIWVPVLAALVVACGGGSDVPADPVVAALARLREYETARRAATDFRSEGAVDGALGPDPVAVASIDGGHAA